MAGANPTSGSADTDSRSSRARSMLDRGAFCAAEIAARNEVIRWVDAGAFDRAHDSAQALLEAVKIRRAACEQGGFLGIIDGPCEALIRPGLYLAQPPVVGIDGQRLGESAVASGVAVWVLTREPRTRRDLWPIVGVATQARRAHVEPAFDERTTSVDSIGAEAWTAWFRAATRQLGEVFLAQVTDSSHPAWRASDLLEATRAAPESIEVIEALIEACASAGKSGPAPARPRPISEGEDPHAF